MANVTLATVADAAPATADVLRKAYADLSTAPSAAEAISSTPYGFTQTQANALLANVLEMRAILVAAGLATT